MSQMQNYLIHDGTGQNARMPAALNPRFFQLDERSSVEMLQYARQLSGMIRYFDFEGNNKGDWQLFLNVADKAGLITEQDILKYQHDPDAFAQDIYRLAWLSRPHFVLFQTFLILLDLVKQDINHFTERHLNYYYQNLLGFTLRKPEADSVYLLAEPTKETKEYLLPKGTLLKADKDAAGKARSFQTTEELIVNKAQIAEVRTAVVNKGRLSLAEYYKELLGDTKVEPFLELIKLVYANTNGSFIAFIALISPISSSKIIVDYTKWLFDNTTKTLFLPLSEIRKLYNLRDLVTKDDIDLVSKEGLKVDAPWTTINKILETAARLKSATWIPKPTINTRDFMGRFQDIYNFDPLNLQKLKENPFQKDFQGVEDIFDLSEQLEEQLQQLSLKKENNPLFDADKLEKFKVFITGTLFMPVTVTFDTPFREMMKNLTPIKNNWAKTNRLIKKAGSIQRTKAEKKEVEYNPDWLDLPFFSTDATKHLPDVESRLRIGLNLGNPILFNFTFTGLGTGTNIIINNLDQIQNQLKTVEAWFLLPYEEVQIMLDKATDATDAGKDKSVVFSLLEKVSYKKQLIANQKANLTNDTPPVPVNPPIPFNPIVPHKEDFKGFFAQTDARKSSVEHGKTSAWRTFGSAENPSEVGFAIQSDLLFLSGGTRTIMVDFTLINPNGTPFSLQDQRFQTPQVFDYWLSTKKGWYQAQGTIMTMRFVNITLPEDAPPIEPPTEGMFLGDPDVPVLKIILKNANIGEIHPYISLKEAILKKVILTVSATGLIPTLAENDNGTINPKKPFQPFGSTPTIGSSFLFGHRELFKPLSSLTLNYAWKGIIGEPPTLANHYGNYSPLPSFDKTDATILSSWNKNIREAGPTNLKTFNTNFVQANITTIPPLEISMPDALSEWTRYFRLELNLDLLHNSYVGLAGQKAMEFATALKTTTPNAALFKLNPPYTPEWSTFKINYTATATLFDADTKTNTGAFLHLYPFGYSPIPAKMDSDNKKFLPLLFLPEFADEGSLFIALIGCIPPQQITLLFQVAEGSANPDLEKPPVTWSYLSKEDWKPFGATDLLMEQTAGFSNSGIVKLALPTDAIDNSTLMPQGFHWIKAAVPYNRESVCDIIEIHTQAAHAMRVLEPDSIDDPGISLPPDTITGFYERQPGIKKISQPYVSYGGKSAETNTTFLPRISERLRHRERALTTWDVERLVLAHFPDVFKAKCLPTYDNKGEVVVVLIPNIRDKALYDAFKPKMPVNRLKEIGKFLEQQGALSAKFRATNPVYVELQVKAYIQFRAGADVKFHLALLEEELMRFLAPWAYEEGSDIAINSTIYPSVVVNFMEERPYVDYVAGVNLFKKEEGETLFFPADSDKDGTLQAERPESVWVSAKKHFIYPSVTEATQVAVAYEGIGYMQIDYDFTII